MLNDKETMLVLEEAMRDNMRFWVRQGLDEREAFLKAVGEIKEMTTDPSSPYGKKLKPETKKKFLFYRELDLVL